MKCLFSRFAARRPLATVAFNMRPVRGPWGGSSVFVSQMAAFLAWRGYAVRYDLRGAVDAIVVIDPRDDLQSKAFGMAEIRRYKAAHPGVKVLHRVNECDQRKASAFMDDLLREANTAADFTVFISEWLRDYHAARWFDARRPHACIYNGADPRVFHPVGNRPYTGEGPFRILTHHWSDNRLKGFDEYEALDRILAGGGLPGVELHVIGRWPAGIRWQAAKTYPATSGPALAARLREGHAYITASRWEPCGMHHIEGAQCGLPLLYHEEGGGIVEAGRRYGIGFRGDLAGAVERLRAEYPALRRRLLDDMPSGDRMCLDYTGILQRLVCG